MDAGVAAGTYHVDTDPTGTDSAGRAAGTEYEVPGARAEL